MSDRESESLSHGLHEPLSGAPVTEAASSAPPEPALALPGEREPGHAVLALRGWWDRASPNFRSSLLMILAYCFFSVMITLIKLVGAHLPLAQILLVRQVLVLALLALAVGHGMRGVLRTTRPGLQVMRASFSLGAMFFGFLAIIHLPMAEATSLGFSQVLFVTLGAIVVLGEKVDARRWLAMAIGFAGVLIILRPSGQAMSLFAISAIVGAVFGAGITITVRMLGQTERTETILFWQGLLMTAALLVPAWWLWVPPTPREWVMLITTGIVGTAGQWLITRAYQYGEASALAPLDFVRLLLATLAGFLVFGEIPDPVTVLGASLVVLGTLDTVRRNSRKPVRDPDLG